MTNAIEARDPNFERRVRDSFARQPLVQFIGAQLAHVAPGAIDIRLPRNANLLQQHGYVHGGALTSIADAAAGYAALSVSEPGTGVLTTELKVNFLRPAAGQEVVARGRVLKPGRVLTIVQSDVYDLNEGRETHVLTGLVTMMHMDGMLD
ncbi:MAG: PaaI family thioesterase [Hyphomicrobiaceae bacterium]|nr:PaaI family thioesterase [Hyphomicrobiaceae bacterium]